MKTNIKVVHINSEYGYTKTTVGTESVIPELNTKDNVNQSNSYS